MSHGHLTSTHEPWLFTFPCSDMSDLEEAVTVLPPGHSRGAKTVIVLPPPDKYIEGASEIKSYVTTATTSYEGAEKCIVCDCESVKMRMKRWKSGLNVHNALRGYMKAVSYQTIRLNHKTMNLVDVHLTDMCYSAHEI